MKNDKLTLTHLITFLILIIISLLFFAYTNNTIFEYSNGDIVNCTYSTINLILNSLFIIASVAIIEISIISIKKLPKDKNDYKTYEDSNSNFESFNKITYKNPDEPLEGESEDESNE